MRHIIILLLAVTIFVLFFSELLKMHPEEILRASYAKTISNRGAVGYSDFIPPPPSPPSPVGIDIIGGVIKVSSIITAVGVLWVFAKDIAHLINWLLWRLKYGKSGTPLILPRENRKRGVS